MKNSSSDSIRYYTEKTLANDRVRYVSSSTGLYVKSLSGIYFKARNSSKDSVTLYECVQKTVENTTEETTEIAKTASFKVTTTVQIDQITKTWTNKLEYVATNITEYDEMNRYAQIFMNMVEENDYKYTIDDIAIALEAIEAFYDEEYVSAGSSIDYSALPEGEFGWPVPANKVVSAIFGNTPWYGGYHSGIDVWSVDESGNPDADFKYLKQIDIVAAQAGKVKTAYDGNCADGNMVSKACGENYGNYVEIEHANGYSTVYAHLSPGTIAVKAGQDVVAGQYLGKMGSSGNSSGTHLHYEIKYDGTKLDPLKFYDVIPHKYKVPYADRNNSAITMSNPYKVNFNLN